jgi:hypothetical protein
MTSDVRGFVVKVLEANLETRLGHCLLNRWGLFAKTSLGVLKNMMYEVIRIVSSNAVSQVTFPSAHFVPETGF